MTDLFMTKVAQLKRWCAKREFFNKVQLTKYGLDNGYISAWRRVDEMVQEGIIKHLDRNECAFRGLTGKCAWYRWLGEPAPTAHEEAIIHANKAQEDILNMQAAGK